MVYAITGLLRGSAGKESACSVGDLGLAPGLERSPGEGTATHSSILGFWTTIGYQELSFGWVKSYAQIFNCVGGQCS